MYLSWRVCLCKALVDDKPSPCSGEDGLFALIMAIAAGKSAEEGRWVKFSEIPATVVCTDPLNCDIVDFDDDEDASTAKTWSAKATDKFLK